MSRGRSSREKRHYAKANRTRMAQVREAQRLGLGGKSGLSRDGLRRHAEAADEEITA